MVRIRVKEMSRPAQRFRDYLFLKNEWLEIKNPEHIEYFKNKSEFEIEGIKQVIENKVNKILGIEEGKEDIENKIWNKEELENLDFEELRNIGLAKKVKGRSKSGIIKDILDIQEGKIQPEINDERD